ncbi:AAA family ATPase [Mesorhizobium sp. ASY16-5R]|uniref:AAA family ATPase n=1 Tax=Mesorhizobium sp. ASY16-5R TaxID=3445772 RepID=UPI003F9FE04E
MKISALRLHNVKRFAGRGVAIEGIGDGVNVLCAANEHGKSTSFEALHALFFQPHSGTPGDVQKLRPYSGGNPLVEADIVTAQGRYRLTKQYYGGRRASVTDIATGRLLAQADEAEAFIANLIRGGTSGPAGLLWVRQGVTGIEKRSRAEEDGEKRVRESLLASVQGEVEAMTGGRRMAEIVDVCNEELYRLVTPTMRPKGGGLYEAAVEKHRRLVEEERRLAAEVNAMREALDKRGAALKRLAEIEDPSELDARRGALEKAEAALAAAKTHRAALDAAEAAAALARSRRDTAQQALGGFREAIAQAARLGEQVASAQLHRDDAVARRDAATAEIDRAAGEADAADAAEREARELLARLDRAMAARQAAEHRTEMRDRLDKAEALRAKIEAGETALALLAMPANAIGQLQDLEIKLAGLRAAKNATLPTFRMTYGASAEGRVTLNGAPLPDAVEQMFADVANLEISGIGTLTLRSNRPPEADQALLKAEARHRDLLAALGVSSLAEAHGRQSAGHEKSTGLELDRQNFRHLAPGGLAQLREDVARHADDGAQDLELKADPEDVRQAMSAAGQTAAAARNAAREARPMRGIADKAAIEAETAYAAARGELERVVSVLGPEAERGDKERRLAEGLDEQETLFTKAEAHAATLRATAPDLETTEAALRRARSVRDAATQEAARLRETVADFNGEIRTRSDVAVEEAWREASEAMAAAAERVKHYETEVAVLDRLRRALQLSRSAARDLYLKPIIEELRPLLGVLFDDISIVFDENTLLPQSIRRNGQDEDVERLSGGMREQLSVLTRLAFAKLLARDGRPAPVILDDALVYSDDDRIERMFDALHRQSRDQQILVFSCRQRAFAKLGGNVLHMTAWTPDA